jgi:cytohesin
MQDEAKRIEAKAYDEHRLYNLSANGDVGSVAALLERGVDRDCANPNGETPLYVAASLGRSEVVGLLVRSRADVNKSDDHGRIPLIAASLANRADIVEALLGAGADKDHADRSGRTALFAAVDMGHKAVALALISHLADINKPEIFGATPLHVACRNRRTEMVELLLLHGADKERKTGAGLTPLIEAIECGAPEAVDVLCRSGANVETGSPLCHAICKGNRDMVVRLIGFGADVNRIGDEGRTPLHVAMRTNLDVVRALLAAGARHDAKDSRGFTPLHAACSESRPDCVAELLKAGADANASTAKRQTPLHIACSVWSMRSDEVAQMLIDSGANTEIADDRGFTPLRVACDEVKNSRCVGVLLSAGANVETSGPDGSTPLLAAIRSSHAEVVGMLLAHGADVEHRDNSGCSPLVAADPITDARRDPMIFVMIRSKIEEKRPIPVYRDHDQSVDPIGYIVAPSKGPGRISGSVESLEAELEMIASDASGRHAARADALEKELSRRGRVSSLSERMAGSYDFLRGYLRRLQKGPTAGTMESDRRDKISRIERELQLRDADRLKTASRAARSDDGSERGPVAQHASTFMRIAWSDEDLAELEMFHRGSVDALSESDRAREIRSDERKEHHVGSEPMGSDRRSESLVDHPASRLAGSDADLADRLETFRSGPVDGLSEPDRAREISRIEREMEIRWEELMKQKKRYCGVASPPEPHRLPMGLELPCGNRRIAFEVCGFTVHEHQTAPSVTPLPAAPPTAEHPPAAASATCVVCLERERELVLIPCGHFVLCSECWKEFPPEGATCPICRKAVITATKVFMS